MTAQEVKEKIIALVGSIDRKGKDGLLAYMQSTDFFTSPASSENHLCCEGGLALHSLNVYLELKRINQDCNLGFGEDSIIICGIGHDICKANSYVRDVKNKKVDGAWQQIPYFKYEPKFPCGHGEKSVILLNQYIKLTVHEVLAIRWHMAAWDASEWGKKEIGFAQKQTKLVTALQCADLTASNIVEFGQ
jgi:hypothetical protein